MFRIVTLCLAVSLAGVFPALAQTVPQSMAQIQLSYAPLVKQAAPAVVNIYAQRVVAERRNPFADDPFFGDLFRNFGQATPRVQNSLGSGVIVGADGLVVSNYHVVGQATEIRVVLNDRREFVAEVVLTDEESDLAVLQLQGARDLPALPLADSDKAEVGDLVLAIGNPFGVGQTVSSGIVSGLARSGIAVGSGRGYFLQTDAPINPGNSGGALVNMAGELVGVNTAIITRSGGSNGIGFAIPANLVAQVVAQARDGRARFQRPWAGVTAQAVDANLAEAFGQTIPAGVVLLDLHPDSPLAQAGLQRGDVILSVDGGEVNSAPEMMFRMSAQGIGAQSVLEFRRGSQTREVTVDLIAPPETPPRDTRQIGGRAALSGLEVMRINPAVIAEFGLSPEAEGVLVTQARNLAGRVGLRPGDILLAINGTRVDSTADVVRLSQAQTRTWVIELIREGRELSLRFRL
ncbi:MAG: putative trypsin-like serine protease [Roseibaca calidilacus]|uniref:Do/DeqQ family serine protease n=1 Tax=Roseibaca calidilacus TaxID=1666912 RepID=A0A0N8K7N7_9RHOB|nr:trypsin-like peptidase domain-containing protein [Roseibaca calidilacus]KPP92249.1 MAG: putative trypsin-like serine protease [Roseibaca calidilacus]CUX79543.1 Do/DeqQ family serine protease [Roseibaca calidilacus]